MNNAQVNRLRAALTGQLLTRDDDGYDAARELFNSAIDVRPRIIAGCATVEDVIAALRYARDDGLPLAVRSGGHSVAGASTVEDGLVIDVRPMNSVRVDPAARRVVVGGGATWAAVDRACQPHGLATTGGRVSTTGVAGLTLGGGSGWLERTYGLACDSLVEVEMVTAAGEYIVASASDNPDLFWALHGGGGNFGVATSMTFALHELPVYSMAMLLWPSSHGREVASCFRDMWAGATDEMAGGTIYLNGPPEEFIPADMVGKLCAGALVTFAGPVDRLREFVAPLLALSPPVEMITEIPYADMQCMLDDPPGFRNYWSADYLAELPDAAIDVFCAAGEEMLSPSPSALFLMPWGGAVSALADGSAMANRDAPWVVHPFGMWDDPAKDDQVREWTRAVGRDLAPWTTGATYLNFIGDEGADRVRAGFGRHYPRLAEIKAMYDPDNVFNRWHNVTPMPATATPATV